MMRLCRVSSLRCRRIKRQPNHYSDLLGHLLPDRQITRSGDDHVTRSHPGQPRRLRRSINKISPGTQLRLGQIDGSGGAEAGAGMRTTWTPTASVTERRTGRT